MTIIKEALIGAASNAIDHVRKVTGAIGEAIENAYSKVEFLVNDVKGRCLNLVSLIKGDSSDTATITSYTITTYGNTDNNGEASLYSIGDEMKGEAISVGDPYYAFVTESNGEKTVDNFADTPVNLTLSYTDEMLKNIGASSDDEENIEIFKYSEEKSGYISIGGDVDTDTNEVSVIITEPGQFILAINNGIIGMDGGLLSKVSSKTFTSGSDIYTVSWNSFVRYDGRKHNGVGVYENGALYNSKETSKKAYDLKVSVSKNGKVIDPSNYSIKTKHNKKASVSADGVTAIQTDVKKLPSFTINFTGKEYKAANKEAKKEKFEFGIIPVKLKQNAVVIGKVKTGKNGSTEIKKITFKPNRIAKALKLKYNKNDNKTDYVIEKGSNGFLTISGKNNFYGNVMYIASDSTSSKGGASK